MQFFLTLRQSYFLLALLPSLLLGVDDSELYRALNDNQKAQWNSALAMIEKGKSDVKSGNWYLAREASHPRQEEVTQRTHAAGKRLVEEGEKAISTATQILNRLRTSASQVIATQVQPKLDEPSTYSTDFLKSSGTESLPDFISKWIYDEVNALGFSKTIFDGVYQSSSGNAEKDAELTEKVFGQLLYLDGTRFSVESMLEVKIEDGEFTRAGKAFAANNALVYGLISPLSEDADAPNLISIHIVDPSSWRLRKLLNVVDAQGPSAQKNLLLEDANNFFERLSANLGSYHFRLNYSTSVLNSVEFGAWIPAGFKSLTLEQNLAGIIDADSLAFIYGKDGNAENIFNAKGNASFVFQKDQNTSRIQLSSESDQSGQAVEIGSIDLASAPL